MSLIAVHFLENILENIFFSQTASSNVTSYYMTRLFYFQLSHSYSNSLATTSNGAINDTRFQRAGSQRDAGRKFGAMAAMCAYVASPEKCVKDNGCPWMHICCAILRPHSYRCL